ncbi:hypothetical protein diail_2165 [Diaporthe ilicicola]|nr:hypothetical protein diail_2165 [Diaporthe ilicicola]
MESAWVPPAESKASGAAERGRDIPVTAELGGREDVTKLSREAVEARLEGLEQEHGRRAWSCAGTGLWART